MLPKVSVGIRTLNEQEKLRNLLEAIGKQDYSGEIEIVVVDNESHDKTKEVAENYGCKVINIPRDEFTYPKSMNLAAANSSGEIVILTVGHATPVTKDWISTAVKHLSADRVAGVYSPVIPMENGTFFDWLLLYPAYLRAKITGIKAYSKIAQGVFGATNCAFKKKDWEEMRFDESYQLGGEDTLWAKIQFQKGRIIIRDSRFAVRHCHYLGLVGFFKQIAYWSKLSRPTKFSREHLSFRRDIDLH